MRPPIADLVPARDWGREVGTNDAFATAGSVFPPLVGGPVIELFGLPSLANVSTRLLLIPLVMLLRLDETVRQPLTETVGDGQSTSKAAWSKFTAS